MRISQHHDGLRKMVRDYPKIVERLKTQIIKWQASENRIWMLGQVMRSKHKRGCLMEEEGARLRA